MKKGTEKSSRYIDIGKRNKMKDELTLLVIESYEEVLNLQNGDFEKPDRIYEKTSIYGSTGYLDSLGLVNLIVTIEDKIHEKFNVSISITDEKAMSRTRSPFRDVESLSLYLEELLRGKSDE